jgi:hypothetical protein
MMPQPVAAAEPAGLLARFARPSWTPDFPESLPSNLADYLAQTSVAKLAFRRLRRLISLWLGRQFALCRATIPVSTRRVLWLYKGTPQVGDSLMDLAGRTLLRGADFRIDLYTDPHLAKLYAGDDVFDKVLSAPEQLDSSHYDLVILHSYSSHCLREKLRLCPDVPFVPFYGYYTGPEFNRTLFSYFRVNSLLPARLSEPVLRQMAKPHLHRTAETLAQVDGLHLPKRFIALAVGGVREWRTYTHWPAVLDELAKRGWHLPVVLLGSDNGLSMRDQLIEQNVVVLVDQVDRLELPVVAEVLARAELLLCADGGLMHVANAVSTPVVALLAQFVLPELRFCAANRATTLYASDQVSSITPESVADAVMRALPASFPA